MSLVGLLVLIIVFGLIAYVVNLLPLPAPFKTVAMVVLLLFLILVLANMFGVLGDPIIIRKA